MFSSCSIHSLLILTVLFNVILNAVYFVLLVDGSNLGKVNSWLKH